jgi:RNA polymerase sigma factor (sigma-70 family)
VKAALTRARRRSASFADLQVAAGNGERWAINALAERYLGRLTGLAAARGAADPGGVANLSMLAVLRRLDQLHFGTEDQFWAYLCQTVRNRIIDEHRATKPVELMGDGHPERLTGRTSGYSDATVRGADLDEQVAQQDYVDELLSPLTVEQRQVLELRFFDDLSIEETALRTGRTQGAVKGLQRRAINAIIAAVAVVLVVLAVRGFGGSSSVPEIDDRPADGPTNVENPPPEADANPSPDVDLDLDPAPDLNVDPSPEPNPNVDPNPDPDPGANVDPNPDADPGANVDPNPDADPDPGGGAEQPVQQATRFAITVGSARAVDLYTGGEAGPESAHGVRVYCPASHIAYDDPIRLPGASGSAPAQLYWGNTGADAGSDGPSIAERGNSTCEGGINDRSAYWMPAVFSEDDEVVIPELIRVEFKSFGGPDFDRSTIMAIPAGLELVAEPAVSRSAAHNRGSASGGTGSGSGSGSGSGGLKLNIVFPTCVATDSAGQPLLSSPDGATHLSFAGSPEGASSNCPASHPYRIPQLGFALEYAVPFDSGWYLSTDDPAGPRGPSDERMITAGAIVGWQPEAMDGVVTCNRELIGSCDFLDIDQQGGWVGRAQLPERFSAPDGTRLYTDSVSLADTADRTPFGATLTPRL